MRGLLGLVGVLACTWVGPGCARDLARASSGALGCAPAEIEVDDVSVGWAETSWAASCRGASFRCAGEHAPACAPLRDASVEPVPAPVPSPDPEPAPDPASVVPPKPEDSHAPS